MKVIYPQFRFFMVLVFAGWLFLLPAMPAHAAGTTITVNSAVDDTIANLALNSTCDLREAIQEVNNNDGSGVGSCPGGSAPYTIAFKVGGSGPQTITLKSELDVEEPVLIDGTTQPPVPHSSPLIRIDGSGSVGNGISFQGGSEGSVMKGLMVTGFINTAVKILAAGNSSKHITLTGNYIGTDGTNGFGGVYGLGIDGGDYAQVGGPTSADRNVISGVSQNVLMSSGADFNTIQGNYIGLNASGTAAVGGSSAGFLLSFSGTSGASNNIIEGNVISGNGSEGIWIYSQYDNNNVIRSNYIGTNASGTAAVGPSTEGIVIDGGDSNQVGGTTPGSGNVISGNSDTGVVVNTAATGTIIHGNKIGTDPTGTNAIPNGMGIHLYHSSANIGNLTTPGNNVISGNDSSYYGILVENSTGTTIYGNKIGVNAAGTGGIPNGTGISLGSASAAIANNWIGSSSFDGVYVDSTSTIDPGSSNNCFTNNIRFGVNGLNTSTNAVFGSNWWNASTGPTNGVTNSGGSGDAITNYVDFSPFLTSPTAACSAVVSLSTTSQNFGNQLVGTPSALKTVTLTNAGGKQMHLTSISLNAPFSRDASSTCPTGSGNLLPGASCTIKIKFSPTATGLVTHNLTINTNAATSPNQVTLKGTGVAGTQLLKNPGFEIDANHDNKPDNWSFINFNAATDRRDCTDRKNGICSLKLAGNSLQKIASQTVTKSGVAGDDFTFSLWSKSNSIPALSIYRMQVLFYKGTILKGNITKNFTPGSHPFQKVSGTFTAPTAYTKIVFKIIFKANSGTAWFDTATLNWAP